MNSLSTVPEEPPGGNGHYIPQIVDSQDSAYNSSGRLETAPSSCVTVNLCVHTRQRINPFMGELS